MRLDYEQPHRATQLLDELIAAIPALAPVLDPATGRYQGVVSLTSYGSRIVLDVPDAVDPAAVQAVVTAHVPAWPAPLDYGEDAPEPTREQARTVITQLRAYLAAETPTAAQTVGALKLLIRITLWFVRQRFG